MSRTIWKYPLALADRQTIMMPAGKPLTVQMQGAEMCLWAEISPGATDREVVVDIVGTGHKFDPTYVGDYLCTIQQHSGQLIWHVYIGGHL